MVNYIDLQLSGPFRKLRPRYRSGLAAIEQSCAGRFQKSFTELQPDRQTEFLSTLDRKLTPFFNLVIAHTMQGYYGDPRHGANRDAVSWRMLGVPVIPIRGRSPYQFPPQGIGS